MAVGCKQVCVHMEFTHQLLASLSFLLSISVLQPLSFHAHQISYYKLENVIVKFEIPKLATKVSK